MTFSTLLSLARQKIGTFGNLDASLCPKDPICSEKAQQPQSDTESELIIDFDVTEESTERSEVTSTMEVENTPPRPTSPPQSKKRRRGTDIEGERKKQRTMSDPQPSASASNSNQQHDPSFELNESLVKALIHPGPLGDASILALEQVQRELLRNKKLQMAASASTPKSTEAAQVQDSESTESEPLPLPIPEVQAQREQGGPKLQRKEERSLPTRAEEVKRREPQGQSKSKTPERSLPSRQSQKPPPTRDSTERYSESRRSVGRESRPVSRPAPPRGRDSQTRRGSSERYPSDHKRPRASSERFPPERTNSRAQAPQRGARPNHNGWESRQNGPPSYPRSNRRPPSPPIPRLPNMPSRSNQQNYGPPPPQFRDESRYPRNDQDFHRQPSNELPDLLNMSQEELISLIDLAHQQPAPAPPPPINLQNNDLENLMRNEFMRNIIRHLHQLQVCF